MSRSLYSIFGFEDSHSITTTKPTNEGTVYENEENISDIRQCDEKVALLNHSNSRDTTLLIKHVNFDSPEQKIDVN